MKVCPHCRELLNEAIGVTTSQRPQAGDFTICGRCGAPLQFVAIGGTMVLAKVPKKDIPPSLKPLLEKARGLAHTDRMDRINWKTDDLKQLALDGAKKGTRP